MKKFFLITGANFNNKGAQSMLFITICELRNHYPDCCIDVVTSEEIDEKYRFNTVNISYENWIVANSGLNSIRYKLKNIINQITDKPTFLLKNFHKQLQKYDALIDISGYSLSSQRGIYYSKYFLTQINVAKRYKIPVFLMPQSFGPFEYKTNNKKMHKLIKNTMKYPEMIFVREDSGINSLFELGVKNVIKSCDLVLQNREINIDKIYDGNFEIKSIDINTKNNVAVIPNENNFLQTDKNKVLIIYKTIINHLCGLGKNVYLIRHSGEDYKACKLIYDNLENKKNVFLINYDFNCFEYSNLLDSFDYIVASRFHSIVHSYKKGVPAIVLGWADKYYELLNLFDQCTYMFDVRSKIKEKNIISVIDMLNDNFKSERLNIISKLPNYQKDNCFDSIFECIDRR